MSNQGALRAEREKTLRTLASAMKKTLPPHLLQELIDHCDPLSAFLRELRKTEGKK